ncbi:MAG TPA: bifunctional [glutamate--ammonia ligase]-adenylyl-L-tyrosine phosphorylase/[glutamate--ammonia-ligase] adenylyltransferase, partial [Verrucomicrobiae bacterium]|nr:bifunctional [glutamate--ammonia ligase]-adenylyl-L-tyrosine phosphorylase/[glutamate--ammonia-ligase] adenylyltransferase [Verrucomicrobiae bacterium]
MKRSDWQKLAQASAVPPRAEHFLEALNTAVPDALKRLTEESARVLMTILGGSQALGELLVAHPDWLPVIEFNQLQHPRRRQGFQREVDALIAPRMASGDHAVALAELRRFKEREQLRIAARDLARCGDVVEITQELSEMADVCLNAVLRMCSRQFVEKYGTPFHQDADGHWQPTSFCVLGLGKLGGQELNYSSDVDLLFVYGEEGEVFKELPMQNHSPRAVMSNHQYFCKLAELFIAEVSRATADGFLFRVDLRLRPEGDTGPICRSLESYESYYAEWGQTWERMMLIKARHSAGDGALANEFLETIQSFRFPPFIGENILREVTGVKSRIEKEVVGADELERNVKLGRGGIREIEFLVQSLQILHAGKQPFLQVGQTLPCLAKLAQYHLLPNDDAQQLDAAYRFLRNVEHRLQMEENRQTHTIPADRAARLWLARLMNFHRLGEFESVLRTHTGNVRRIYEKWLKDESPQTGNGLPPTFDGFEARWEKLLSGCAFRDPMAAFHLFKEFAEGPGYVHVSTRTTELARGLIPRFLALCPKQRSEARGQRSEVRSQQRDARTADLRPLNSDRCLSDPDRVLTRLDSFISAYGTRSALLEIWNGNPAAFEMLLLLFDRSEFLAELALRSPDLIDEFMSGHRLRQRKNTADVLKDLRHGLNDADQHFWLRRYHEAELMRLGLRDILGLADFEQNLVELSALADACLQYALEAVMQKHHLKTPPFVIIGLGKLGGCEIDYGSDLDVLFITGAKESALPRLQRHAAEVKDLLSARTEQGIVFHTDARLRPDGEKGLLVNTFDAYENYYRGRAQLWEIQALTRTRPIAGDMALGEKFQKLSAALTDFKPFSSVA